MALEAVKDYVRDLRTLVQDTIVPYRYDDTSVLVAFDTTLLEARRLRADLFLCSMDNLPQFAQNLVNIQNYDPLTDDTPVPMEPPFRMAILFGLTAHVLMRDQEDIQDVRSTMFLGAFNAMLVGTTNPGLVPQQKQQG